MKDWERKLDKKLKALPPIKAPASLLPAVMAEIRSRERWAWWSWSAPERAASLAGLAAAAGAVGYGPGELWARIPHGGTMAALARSSMEVLAALARPLAVPALLAYLCCAAGLVAVAQLSARPRAFRRI